MKEKLDYRTREAKEFVKRFRAIEGQAKPDWFPFSGKLLHLRLSDIDALFTYNNN